MDKPASPDTVQPDDAEAKRQRAREKRREWNARPEVKAQRKAYNREYNSRPEVKARTRARQAEYRKRPEVRERGRIAAREQRAKAKRNGITAERVRELLNYDPDTGLFQWKVDRSQWVPAGRAADHDNGDGHLRIVVDGGAYLAHRLAWLYVHGEWPPGMLDHRNGDGADNRIRNLRPATRKQNRRNQHGPQRRNKTGVRGVYLTPRGRYIAQCRHNGSLIHLGTFGTIAEAAAAVEAERRRRFGDFAGTGRLTNRTGSGTVAP